MSKFQLFEEKAPKGLFSNGTSSSVKVAVSTIYLEVREAVLTFVFGITGWARECQSRRKVNTGMKVNTGDLTGENVRKHVGGKTSSENSLLGQISLNKRAIVRARFWLILDRAVFPCKIAI